MVLTFFGLLYATLAFSDMITISWVREVSLSDLWVSGVSQDVVIVDSKLVNRLINCRKDRCIRLTVFCRMHKEALSSGHVLWEGA